MNMRYLISLLFEAPRAEALARATEDFRSVESIVAWARDLDVKLEARTSAIRGKGFNSVIDLSWIERGPAAPAGTGRLVVEALCRFADKIGALIELQAADEIHLPGYYEEFGFEEFEDKDADHDVRPSGPDMRRFPQGFKRARGAKKPVQAAQAPVPRASQPVGVLVWFNAYGYLHYAIVDASALQAQKKAILAWGRTKARAEGYAARLLGYVVDTPAWTAQMAVMQPIEPLDHLTFRRQDLTWASLKNHSMERERDEYERWARLPTAGALILDTDDRRRFRADPSFR